MKELHVCYYVEGPTSSNKTGIIVDIAAARFKIGKRSLLVGPSIRCLNEYKMRGEKAHPSATFEVFHSDMHIIDGSGCVRVDVERALNNDCQITGRILCITQQTFQNLDPRGEWNDWHVMIDEAMDVYEPREKNLHYSHSVITKALGVEPEGSTYARLVVTDPINLRAVMEDRNDDALHKEVKSIASRLLNSNFDNFTIASSYASLVGGKGNRNKLYAYSVYSPRVLKQFSRVTVLAARFSETIHYNVWEHEGVDWVRDTDLTQKLRFQSHAGYDSLTIHYGYNGQFSKSSRDKNPDIYASFTKSAVSMMESKPFIRLENNDIKFNSDLAKADGG